MFQVGTRISFRHEGFKYGLIQSVDGPEGNQILTVLADIERKILPDDVIEVLAPERNPLKVDDPVYFFWNKGFVHGKIKKIWRATATVEAEHEGQMREFSVLLRKCIHEN